MCGSRFHFHHWPFGPTRQVGRVAPLQHHAFDGFGILAGAGACGIGARGHQRFPAIEGNGRRQVDARVVELLDEFLEVRAALDERQFAQIVLIVAEQIVGAQMDRKILDQFRRNDFSVQPLLQHVEGLHAALAQHQQLAVDGAGQMQRRHEVGKAFGDVLAGARIKPRLHVAALVAARDRLHANAVPFPFRDEVRRIETGEIRILDRMRQHDRAGTARDRD